MKLIQHCISTILQIKKKDFIEKSKVYRQANAKRIQHHQTSFTTNAEGTPLGGKEKAMTRNKKITKWKCSLVKTNLQQR